AGGAIAGRRPADAVAPGEARGRVVADPGLDDTGGVPGRRQRAADRLGHEVAADPHPQRVVRGRRPRPVVALGALLALAVTGRLVAAVAPGRGAVAVLPAGAVAPGRRGAVAAVPRQRVERVPDPRQLQGVADVLDGVEHGQGPVAGRSRRLRLDAGD